MLRLLALAGALLCTFTINAEARYSAAHPDCNVLWPCEGVVSHPRGERVVKAMGGFGTAKKVYRGERGAKNHTGARGARVAKADWRSGIRQTPPRARPLRTEVASYGAPTPSVAYTVNKAVAQVIGGRPANCPRAYCGCGASLHLFGKIVPGLNLAANWLRFPRAAPAPGMVAARRGHVFVLKQHLGGNTWLAHDSNSGRGLTRLHARSLAGYSIVNPHGGSA